MIDRLAYVALGVRKRLPGLPHHQRHEPRAVGLEQVGGALKYGGARFAAQPVPIPARGFGRSQRLVNDFGAGGSTGPNHNPTVMWRDHPGDLTALLDLFARHDGTCRRLTSERLLDGRNQWLAYGALPQWQ